MPVFRDPHLGFYSVAGDTVFFDFAQLDNLFLSYLSALAFLFLYRTIPNLIHHLQYSAGFFFIYLNHVNLITVTLLFLSYF